MRTLSRFSGAWRSAAILAHYFAFNMSISNAAAFSVSAPAIAPLLSDPTLLGDGVPGSDTFDVIDPGASNQSFEDGSAIIAKVRKMGRKEAKDAIGRASAALPGWKDGTTALARSGVLSKWSELIKNNSEDIARIMTLESGKPLAEARGEVSYGTSFLDYYAAEAIRQNSAGGGYLVPTPFAVPGGTSPRGKIMAVHEAVGVCALITPWNFPIAMITRKAGPALAAGCTAVLKPSELTPLSAVALSVLAKRSGVPDGVLELVTADRDSAREVGEEMCANPVVKKVSFTGSTAVGKLLMKQSSESVKRLSLELGGNAAFVVFDDADIDVAVSAAMSSKFRNAGQTCVCSDRFIVHKSVEKEFLAKLTDRVKRLKVGHGMKEGIAMGPVISASQVKNVKEKVDGAVLEGATCLVGGAPLAELGPNYFAPTVLADVDAESPIWSGETFGPVAAVATFDSEAEALRLANDGPSGLASYFCTGDLSRAFRFSSALECGLVGINEGIISYAGAPFGGVKESGLGREGSVLGIGEYLETKYVFLNT